MLAAILDFSDRTMIQANHPRFSCTSDMSLTIYGIIFSGPLMHTDTPSGTVLFRNRDINRYAGTGDFGNYHTKGSGGSKHMPRQSLRQLHTCSMDVDVVSDKDLDL